ncbi:MULTISPECIES: hypothetical protein [unclassified Paenibacillus]|uniref:Uncharacterized protein n=1 Tax=Paenibacillus provencensis TaxID=441151 RepID=A0ABW3PUF4_9BACL|nr:MULTISPECIES: hypothetical protein [unclassified Paenibacillus]SFS50694.1 hypothetical protein SAMN04488601_1011227 [Paenibacillus sp. 453mf]
MLEAEKELLISQQSPKLWTRRRRELAAWIERPKPTTASKALSDFNGVSVDAPIYPALIALQEASIQTEFSCAGVSILDEADDHSLYAYVTMLDGPATEYFVRYAMERMGHRLLVTYEQDRGRYDVSSFYIAHNRSFCYLLAAVARDFNQTSFYE